MIFGVTIQGDKIVITHGENMKHKLLISQKQVGSLMICLESARHFLAEDHQFSAAVIEDVSE